MEKKKRQTAVSDRFLKIREAAKSTTDKFQGADTILQRFTKEGMKRKRNFPLHLPPPFKRVER